MTDKKVGVVKTVMLWGVKKLRADRLEKFVSDMTGKKEQPLKETKKKEVKKVVKLFDPDEQYTVKDLPFLEQEFERITKEMMKKGHSDEEQEKWDDLQATIDDVIEAVKATAKFHGSGVVQKLDITPDDYDDVYACKESATITGGMISEGDKYKCPLCDVSFNDKTKMTRHLTTKKHLKNIEGIEDKKAFNDKLLKVARKERTDKTVKRKEPVLKPYFYVGPIPDGYREATETEAITKGKYGDYGKYKIDAAKLNDFKTIGMFFDDKIEDRDLYVKIVALKGKLKRLRGEYNHKLGLHGFKKLPEKRQDELRGEANEIKKVFDKGVYMYNKLLKLAHERKGKPFKDIEIKITDTPIRSEEKPLSQATLPPYTPLEVPSKHPKTQYLTFSAKDQEELKIPESSFTYDPRVGHRLKTSVAEKLYKLNIRLDKKFYEPDDVERFFYKQKEKRGGLIGVASTIIDYKAKHRDSFSTKVKRLLKRVGNEPIRSIVINRTPVQSVLTSVLNVLTFGDFKKKLAETPYDKLYHLRLEINNKFSIEKNAIINMDMPLLKAEKDTEKKTITTGYKPGLTLNTLLYNAEKGMGTRAFYTYSGSENNCQDFCIALLKYSGIGDKSDYDFIKQDVESIFRGKDSLKGFMDKITNLGGVVQQAVGGTIRGPIFHSKVQSVLFKRPQWTETEAQKWLVKNQYEHLVVDKKPKHLRYRQYDPEDLKKSGYHFRTQVLPDGIELIIAYPKSISIKAKHLKSYHD